MTSRILSAGQGVRRDLRNQLSQNPEYTAAWAFTYANGYRITLFGQAPNGTNDPSTAGTTLPLPTSNVDLAHPTNTQVISYLPNNQNSSIQESNIQLSQQISDATTANVAYVHTKADHLVNHFNLNGPQLIGAAVPFPGQSLNVIVGAANGTSHYNGLQCSLNHRFTQGLQYTVAYTYSHSTDNSHGAFSSTGGNQEVFIDAPRGGFFNSHLSSSSNH
ncbi:MAG: hypothetical protein ABI383_16140 [Acidobacteriaceae bacterium]